jgi:hypothetical protein
MRHLPLQTDGELKHQQRRNHPVCGPVTHEPQRTPAGVVREAGSNLSDYNGRSFRPLPQRYDMRILQIVGAILIAGGLFVLIKAPTYSSDKSVFKIGDVEAKVAQERAIPPWAGGVAVAAGAVLLVVGARKP